MLSRGGREGGKEVTGGKVNYELMPENIKKGGDITECAKNLRVQVLMCQSCPLNATRGGLRINMRPYFML